MRRLKPQPTRDTQHELRNQRTAKGNAWTASLSGGYGLSASNSASRGCAVLGRSVSTRPHDGNHGGHDEQ